MRVTFNNAIQLAIRESFGVTTNAVIKNPFDYSNSTNYINFSAKSFTAVVEADLPEVAKTPKGLEYSYNKVQLANDSIMFIKCKVIKSAKR
jgi:hypothetical protein